MTPRQAADLIADKVFAWTHQVLSQEDRKIIADAIEQTALTQKAQKKFIGKVIAQRDSLRAEVIGLRQILANRDAEIAALRKERPYDGDYYEEARA